jgi:hypothetical protein
MRYQDLPPGRQRRIMFSKLIASRPYINYQLCDIEVENNHRQLFFNQQEYNQQEYNQQEYNQENSIEEYNQENSNEENFSEEYNHVNQTVNLINKILIKNSLIKLNYFQDNFCVICQENISICPKEKSIVRVINCSHCFHIDCIDNWFTFNNNCPTCKFKLN